MSGIQEFNNKYIKRINNILKDWPDFLKGFIGYMIDVSLPTKYTYLCDVVGFLKEVNKPVEELTFDDFANYISNLEYKEDGTRITSSYRIAVYSALKRFNEYLFNAKKISDNYMLYIKRPKRVETQETIKKRAKGFLTKKEISTYLQTIEDNIVNDYRNTSELWNKRDMAIIQIFLTTGIRCSALFKLDITSVDFNNYTLIVTDKGDNVKLFKLSDTVIETIKEWLDIRREKINDDNNALFISNRRTRMTQKTIGDVVKKYSKNIKGKDITPHKLRATYGTQLHNITHDIYFVQQSMGHASPSTTELYVRGKEKDTSKAMDIMSEFLF